MSPETSPSFHPVLFSPSPSNRAGHQTQDGGQYVWHTWRPSHAPSTSHQVVRRHSVVKIHHAQPAWPRSNGNVGVRVLVPPRAGNKLIQKASLKPPWSLASWSLASKGRRTSPAGYSRVQHQASSSWPIPQIESAKDSGGVEKQEEVIRQAVHLEMDRGRGGHCPKGHSDKPELVLHLSRRGVVFKVR
jgi:hypothetical protein